MKKLSTILLTTKIKGILQEISVHISAAGALANDSKLLPDAQAYFHNQILEYQEAAIELRQLLQTL